jgi:hypothetical protein
VDVRRHIPDHVAEDVQPHQINRAEGRGLRPAYGLTGQRIDIFNAQVHLLHEPHYVQNRKSADAVADEVGRVLGKNYSLPETHVAELGNGIDQSAVRVWGGNEFEQSHIARRIEEMRAEPRAPEIVGEALGNLADRQPASVGGNDGAGLANGFDFAQQRALEIKILDDRLDDPIDFGELLQVVFKITHSHQTGERRIHKRRGFGFSSSFQTSRSDLVPRWGVGVGRNDIQQITGNARVGKMCGDACSHRSRA